MNIIVSNIVRDLSAQLLDTMGRLLKKMVLLALAALCVVVALVFATIALDLWLSSLFGPVIASLVMAGAFLLVAVVAVLFALYATRASAPPQSEASGGAGVAEFGSARRPACGTGARASSRCGIDEGADRSLHGGDHREAPAADESRRLDHLGRICAGALVRKKQNGSLRLLKAERIVYRSLAWVRRRRCVLPAHPCDASGGRRTEPD